MGQAEGGEAVNRAWMKSASTWARGLSDHDLVSELATLQKKCSSTAYRSGLGGHLLKAVERETERRRHPKGEK